jgi:exopolysaccharide biosynthesis polyprenyl glycosylphosphotransferase
MTALRRSLVVPARPAGVHMMTSAVSRDLSDGPSSPAPRQAHFRPESGPGWNAVAHAVKIALDRVAAVIGLILLCPLMLTIALIIQLGSPGPALFAQPRVGCRQKVFNCYKFRSMYHHLAEPQLARQATRNDIRVTPFGRFLRRTSLDELPQLLNVLKGDMSLVGPRPHAPDTRAAGRLFAEVVPHYEERHCVRPGITGWAQVNGWRGETRTPEDIQMRVRYDMDYIRHWSLMLDFRILVLTLLRMFNDDSAV